MLDLSSHFEADALRSILTRCCCAKTVNDASNEKLIIDKRKKNVEENAEIFNFYLSLK